MLIQTAIFPDDKVKKPVKAETVIMPEPTSEETPAENIFAEAFPSLKEETVTAKPKNKGGRPRKK